MRFRIESIALAGLCVLSQPATAQEPDLASFAWPRNAMALESNSWLTALSPSQDATDKPSSPPAKGYQQVQSGTSNDRILWTMPNFLTLENADEVPPLTAKEKFKVTARGIFDPFEFVLIGFMAGINQASNSNPSYGQGMQGYAKRYGTAYADNAIENFMASAVFPSVLHQDPRYYQMGARWILAAFRTCRDPGADYALGFRPETTKLF